MALGKVLISYDVDSKHVDVKNAMKAIGYMETWKRAGSIQSYILPNTTLWHNNKSSDTAIAELQSVCRDLAVKLEKSVAVLATDFVGIK